MKTTTNSSTYLAVYDYQTGAELSDEPSRELTEASQSAGPTGAVTAYLDRTWTPIDPSEESLRRGQGYDVRTVYVQ